MRVVELVVLMAMRYCLRCGGEYWRLCSCCSRVACCADSDTHVTRLSPTSRSLHSSRVTWRSDSVARWTEMQSLLPCDAFVATDAAAVSSFLAMLHRAIAEGSYICLSVCLSVCLSHSWATPTRFKILNIFSTARQCDVSNFLVQIFEVLT